MFRLRDGGKRDLRREERRTGRAGRVLEGEQQETVKRRNEKRADFELTV